MDHRRHHPRYLPYGLGKFHRWSYLDRLRRRYTCKAPSCYSSLNQVKDVLPILFLSLVAAAASLAVQLLGLGYVPELFLQVILFASVYLGGAKLFKFSELSEAASLLCGFVSRRS